MHFDIKTTIWVCFMFSNSFFNTIAKIYQWIISFFSNFQSIFIFLLRITWGYQFFLAGYGKLARIDHIAGYFTSLGIPAAGFNAYLVSSFEMIGGLLLIIGLASRLFSIPLIVIMFTAYSTAHIHILKGFAFITNPALLVNEAPFPFLLTSLIVLFFGPGKISIDGYLKRKLNEQK